MRIYWRVCEKEETNSFVPRWEHKPKMEILKKCWLSVQKNVSDKHSFVIIEDSCSSETLEWLKSTSNSRDIVIIDGKSTQEGQLDYVKLANSVDKYTKKEPDRIHYVLEDDYLHLDNALDILESVYIDGWEGYVLTYDYPDRYTLDRSKTCDLILGSRSHWRTVPSSTGVRSALGKTWQAHMREFKQDAYFNSDAHSHMMFNLVPAICPIPGVSTHLNERCMTPRIDWNTLWDSIVIDD